MDFKKFIKEPFFYFLILFPLGILLLAASKYINGFADLYYSTVYKYLGGFFGSVTGFFPFSLMEVLICAIILTAIYWIVSLVLKSKNGKNAVLKYFKGVLKSIVSLLCLIFFLFSVFCGTNYYRESFGDMMGLKIEKSSVKELYELCDALLEEATESGAQLYRGEDNLTVYEKDFSMPLSAKAEFERFVSDYGIIDMGFGYFGRPKEVFFSEVMSYLQISGVFSPYTFEANVCKNGPDFLKGATMMHEQCHLRGFMNESEANFMAYLACKNSVSPYFQYSGSCLALLHSMNALYSADPDLWYELRIKYPEYIDADMRAQNEYVSSHDTKVSDVSSKVNDTYLKLNDQKDGVQSYGKMVDLLLAYRRSL